MPRRDYDPAALGSDIYPLLNSVVVPRPIAWVSTRSQAGVDNLAPHSFFTVSSVSPPVVQFTSVGRKDSLRNALATREFVVAVCTEELDDAVNATGTDWPAYTSEFDACGLTRRPSTKVAAQGVEQSPVNLECRVVGTHEFGEGASASVVVFGEVVWASVAESVLADGRPEITLLRPVSRLGANEWGAVGEVTDRRRVPFRELQAR